MGLRLPTKKCLLNQASRCRSAIMKFISIRRALESHPFEIGLMLINSVLLAIWAAKDTIALRNIALVLGAILSIIYITKDWQFSDLKKQLISINALPFIFTGLFFVWVILHYYFFSEDSISQLQELQSTWFRVFLSTTLAWGTGLMILRRTILINYLWVGLLAGILMVYVQYAPKALAGGKFFAPDYHGYLFEGKINGVLVGTLVIAGLTGTVIDCFRCRQLNILKWELALWIFGVLLTMYSYVFIYDTRNGLGLAAILFIGLIFSLSLWVGWQVIQQGATRDLRLVALTITILTIFAGIFTYQQLQHNQGWVTLIEDAKIAIQIDKYSEWQTSNSTGLYPKSESGRVVVGNNYERVAWAVVGLKLLQQNPLGVGVLYKPFNILLQKDFPGATPAATHSGWIDLALSFGFPGLLLIWGIIISVFYLGICSDGPFKVTIPIMASMIFLLYLVGELNGKHSIEILFYWLAMLTALQLPKDSNSSKMSMMKDGSSNNFNGVI